MPGIAKTESEASLESTHPFMSQRSDMTRKVSGMSSALWLVLLGYKSWSQLHRWLAYLAQLQLLAMYPQWIENVLLQSESCVITIWQALSRAIWAGIFPSTCQIVEKHTYKLKTTTTPHHNFKTMVQQKMGGGNAATKYIHPGTSTSSSSHMSLHKS